MYVCYVVSLLSFYYYPCMLVSSLRDCSYSSSALELPGRSLLVRGPPQLELRVAIPAVRLMSKIGRLQLLVEPRSRSRVFLVCGVKARKSSRTLFCANFHFSICAISRDEKCVRVIFLRTLTAA